MALKKRRNHQQAGFSFSLAPSPSHLCSLLPSPPIPLLLPKHPLLLGAQHPSVDDHLSHQLRALRASPRSLSWAVCWRYRVHGGVCVETVSSPPLLWPTASAVPCLCFSSHAVRHIVPGIAPHREGWAFPHLRMRTASGTSIFISYHQLPPDSSPGLPGGVAFRPDGSNIPPPGSGGTQTPPTPTPSTIT